jgi:glycosyltransferase involved in cell wall biosynthesis
LKFSIIVAAYNVQLTIEFTLWSLQSQVFRDFEIIIINDCSTDDTEFKILKFIRESKMKKITYIKNPINRGLSVVRNIGINQAKGDFILFLDGDDAYHSESLEMLENRIKTFTVLPDALFFSAATFLEDIGPLKDPYNIKNYKHNKGYDRLDLSNNLIVGIDWFKESNRNGTFFDAACLILFNLNFLTKNKLYFMPNLIFEDTLFTRNVLLMSNKIGVSNELVLLIRKAEGSIMRSPINRKKISSRYIIAKQLLLYKFRYNDNYFYSDSLNMLLINLRAIKKSDQYFFPSLWHSILVYFLIKENIVRRIVIDNLKMDLKKLIGYTNNI